MLLTGKSEFLNENEMAFFSHKFRKFSRMDFKLDWVLAKSLRPMVFFLATNGPNFHECI
ncbi:hypothetical protein PEDI_19090 [Persicobacter diffluens]|uniref:Uncharacterized protein n=1 Tax=Persicobacter diffluens TaxID=981 RepID=A0AAN4VXN5_9BACT|nr:hypothetical protein PEDI_19090 [Persicobacter diffluens]